MASSFFMSNYSVTAFARNDHATSIAMAGSLAGSIFNIVFDYIFIFPVGLGFSGAALATAFCPVVTMSVCMTHYLSKKCHIGFKWKKLSLRHLISCCQLGVSAFVGEISSAVIALVFNFLILGIAGSIGVAAYGIVANLSTVGMSILNGLAQGVQPLISESYGKGEQKTVQCFLSMHIPDCSCISLDFYLPASTFCWWLISLQRQMPVLLSLARCCEV